MVCYALLTNGQQKALTEIGRQKYHDFFGGGRHWTNISGRSIIITVPEQNTCTEQPSNAWHSKHDNNLGLLKVHKWVELQKLKLHTQYQRSYHSSQQMPNNACFQDITSFELTRQKRLRREHCPGGIKPKILLVHSKRENSNDFGNKSIEYDVTVSYQIPTW